MKFLHLHKKSRSLSTWTTTQRRFSRRGTTNSSTTPLTTPIVTYTMLSTLVATRKQSSSTTVKIMKKSKTTARHPTSKYLTITGTIRESGAATRQHLLPNRPNNRRLILLIRNFTQDVSYTLKKSTRVSNASSFAKHSEHLHLLPTKTRRINMSKIFSDNQRRRS